MSMPIGARPLLKRGSLLLVLLFSLHAGCEGKGGRILEGVKFRSSPVDGESAPLILENRPFDESNVTKEPDGKGEYVSDEILISLTPDATDAHLKKIARKLDAEIVGYNSELGIVQLQLPSNQSPSDAIEMVREMPGVGDAFKNEVIRLDQVDVEDGKHESDNVTIDTEPARRTAPTPSDVTVAILDTGIAPHPEFSGRLLAGRNFVNGGTDTSDRHGHGTHVAGIAAAAGGYVSGSCRTCKILPVKVLGDSGCGSWYGILNGITWAAEKGAQAINMSISGAGSCWEKDELAISNARGKGSISVQAAGNESSEINAGCPLNFIVAATDSAGNRASFSNYGSSVDLSAPGVSIMSTYPGGGYRSMSGTSMAAPRVSGAVGCILGLNPGLSLNEVESMLKATADPVNADGPPMGAGLLNLGKACAMNPNRPPAIAFQTDPNPLKPLETTTITATLSDADNDPLTFHWSATGGTLDGSDTTITWTAPDRVGVYTVTLRVSDGHYTVPATIDLSVKTGEVYSLVIKPGMATAWRGTAQQFTSTIEDEVGKILDEKPTWTVAGGIGSVDTEGKFTAGKAGEGQVIAEFKGAQTNAKVTVLHQLPSCFASATPLKGHLPVSIQFAGSAYDPDKTTVTGTWDFGDGTTFDGWGASHTYGQTGTYEAKFTAVDEDGGSCSKEIEITAEPPNKSPTCSVTATPPKGHASLAVQFGPNASDVDGSMTSYRWSFGDGQISTAASPSHTYSNAGLYVATVVVTDDDGATCESKNSIQIEPPNKPPTVTVKADPSSGDEPFTTTLTAAASDTDGTVVSYSWSLGDGAKASASQVTHSYANDGTYTASVTVNDDDGATASAPVTISVNKVIRAPTCTMAASPLSGKAPLKIAFSANATDPDKQALSPKWLFGDGTGTNTYSSSHTYSAEGDYSASFTVTDTDGAHCAETVSIHVKPPNQPPVVNAAVTPLVEFIPVDASFDASGSFDPDGTIVKYAWTFKDGTTNSTPTFSRTFNTPGQYGLTLTLTDDDGATSSVDFEILAKAMAQWAEERGNSDGKSSIPAPGLSAPLLEWKYWLSKQVLPGSFTDEFIPIELAAGPVIGYDGSVFIAGQDGRVRVLNPDGTLRQTIDVGMQLFSLNLMTNGTLLVAGNTVPYPICICTRCYAPSERAVHLSAFSPDGSKLWQRKFNTIYDNHFSGQLVTGPNGHIRLLIERNLYALDWSGNQAWSWVGPEDFPISLNAVAVADDGMTYVTSNKHLHALRPDGSVGWTLAAPVSRLFTRGAVLDQLENIVLPSRKMFDPLAPAQVHRYSRTGSFQWTADIPDHDPYAMAIGRLGQVYVSASTWNSAESKSTASLSAVSPNGKLLWNLPAAPSEPSDYWRGNRFEHLVVSGMHSDMVYAVGRVLQKTTEDSSKMFADYSVKELHAIDGEKGSILWKYSYIDQYASQAPWEYLQIGGVEGDWQHYLPGSYPDLRPALNNDGRVYLPAAGSISALGPSGSPASIGLVQPMVSRPSQPILFAGAGSVSLAHSWKWDFGDGTSSVLQDATHSYSSPGARTVTLSMIDRKGNAHQDKIHVYVDAPPTCNLTASVTEGPVPLPVSFHTNAIDPENRPKSTFWQAGDFSGSGPSDFDYTFTTTGTFEVHADVKDPLGNVCSTHITIQVNPNKPPTCDFVADTTLGPAPLNVSLTSSAGDPEGGPVTLAWNFGDGATATSASVSHTYSSPGVFKATLAATDDRGATCSKSVDIRARALPTCAASMTPTQGRVPLTVSFGGSATDSDGTVISAGWNFGDGTTASTGFTSHTYGTPGAFSSAFTAVDNEGDACSKTFSINILPPNKPPTCSASVSPSKGHIPASTQFFAAASDSDGSIASYQWTFGDGSPSSAAKDPMHQYAAAGAYAASLLVTDNEGATCKANISFTAEPPNKAPTVSISADPTKGPEPLPVQFSAVASDADGQVVAYNWNFGDGTSSAQKDPSHKYTGDGWYSVSLTVKDDDGAVASATTTIMVEKVLIPPTCTASANPIRGHQPLSVHFVGAAYDSDGSIASTRWTFGDGWSASTAVKDHTYFSQGTYQPVLTVVDNDGLTCKKTLEIIVDPPNKPPIPKITAQPTSGYVPLEVSFDGTGSTDPDGVVAKYEWDFGDGGTSTSPSPLHTFTQWGVYVARLTVTDDDGAVASTYSYEIDVWEGDTGDGEAWRMFASDAAHTNYSGTALPSTLEAVTTISPCPSESLGGVEYNIPILAPAVMSGLVFFTTSDRLHAVDAFTGKCVWSKPVPYGSDDPTPAVGEGVIVYTTGNELYGYDLATGRHLWGPKPLYTCSDSTSPTILNGTVYIATCENNLTAWDLRTGDLRWASPAGFRVTTPFGSPTVYMGKVWQGGTSEADPGTGQLLHVNSSNGSSSSGYPLDFLGGVPSAPVAKYHTVYVGDLSGTITAVDEKTATPKWTFKAGGGISTTPAVVRGKVVFGSWDHTVYALDAFTGVLLWSTGTDHEIRSNVAVTDEHAVVVTRSGTVYLLNLENGSIIDTVPLGVESWASPALAHGMVYIGGTDGNIHVLGDPARLNSLSKTWMSFGGNAGHTGLASTLGPTGALQSFTFTSGGGVNGSVVLDDAGNLHFGASSGTFYSLERDGTVRWSHATGIIRGSATLDGEGNSVVAAENGIVYKFSPQGNLIWTYWAANTLHASPCTGPGGEVYVGDTGGMFHGISSTGAAMFKVSIGDAARNACATDGAGNIYVGGGDSYVRKFSPTGSKLFERWLPGRISASPVVADDGTVYVSTHNNGYVYALSSGGGVLWYVGGSGGLAVAHERVHVQTASGLAVYSTQGAPIWSFALPAGCSDPVTTSPVVDANGNVFFKHLGAGCTGTATLYALDRDGNFLWNASVPGGSQSSPSLGRGRSLYIGSGTGLHVFGQN